MTTRIFSSLFALLLSLAFVNTAIAQDDAPAASTSSYTPPHMSEIGVHAGAFAIFGDSDRDVKYGAGLHFRRALDYVFSVRIDANYLVTGGSFKAPRLMLDGKRIKDYEATIIGGGIKGIITLNNLNWRRTTAERKVGLYLLGGVSVTQTTVEGTIDGQSEVDYFESNDISNTVPFVNAGGGISFKLSPKVNLGVEVEGWVPFGAAADMIDGDENVTRKETTYRDILGYGSVRLGINLGDADEKTEPLYWINPMEGVVDDISELKARPVFDLTDSDGDGVIDMLDQEADTPAGAAVNTRGEALDSDGDGVADYMDSEPYSPPGFSVDGKGVAQMPNYATKADVKGMIDDAVKGLNLSQGHASIADWFLPMIHFNVDSYSIRYNDYGAMASIAQVMKNNPSVRVVVKGFTDKTASSRYNDVLSYNRAKSAIEHLVNNYGISRDRLILNYGGEENTLVPQSGSSLMNRRVEFKVSTGVETEMGRPEGPNAGKGTFGGTRNAGY